MERYLKRVTLEAKDGSVVIPPVCCANCTKKECPMTCKEYEELLKEAKCTRVEMEFGIASRKNWSPEILIGLLIIGFVVCSYVCLKPCRDQGCEMKVAHKKTALSMDTSTAINFRSTEMDVGCLTQSVNRVMNFCKELNNAAR